MKERPILFSGPMVLAILEGRKTQTRRVMKTQLNSKDRLTEYRGVPGPLPSVIEEYEEVIRPKPGVCPYGDIGDRLWVKETFFDIRKWEMATGLKTGVEQLYDYRADVEVVPGSKVKWKPSIFMPRKASRITLEITDVRVQRVRDISHDDAVSEGCAGHGWKVSDTHAPHIKLLYPVAEYLILWNSLNEKRGFGWDKNPWVWAITFKRISGGNDAAGQ